MRLGFGQGTDPFNAESSRNDFKLALRVYSPNEGSIRTRAVIVNAVLNQFVRCPAVTASFSPGSLRTKEVSNSHDQQNQE